jgi:GNAT superfamily N-acetyltransferase
VIAWRVSTASDDQAIVSMCTALNAEDAGPFPVPPEQVRRTLAKLREEPHRGRGVVCQMDGPIVGYALRISFWSNELGGEVCTIDELFVGEEYRGRGLATKLIEQLTEPSGSLWPTKPAALALEVNPHNQRARALMSGLGSGGKRPYAKTVAELTAPNHRVRSDPQTANVDSAKQRAGRFVTGVSGGA